MSLEKTSGSSKPPRWGWLGSIWVLAGSAEIYNRVFSGSSHQDKNLFGFKVWLATILFSLIWLVFLSRLRWKTRSLAILTFLTLALAAISTLKITGVSGDLLPVVEWRFNKRASIGSNALVVLTNGVDINTRLLSAATNQAMRFTQFQGNSRDGTVSEFPLETNWTAHPPKILWRRPVGPGWSGFVFSDGLAFTQEQEGENELVTCYDFWSGNLRWAYRYPARYYTTIAGEGPRSTPALQGGLVVTLGSTGILNCLDQKTGKLLWSRNVLTDNQAGSLEWGISCSPLIVNKRVVVSAGGTSGKSLAAYDLETGRPGWSAGENRASYSSPVLMNLSGRDQILIINSGAVKSHDPESGRVLWSHPWHSAYPNIATPVQISTNRVLFSSGYAYGSELLEISGGDPGLSATQIWKSKKLKSKMSNLFFYRGFFYGLDDGIFTCVDVSGAQRWKDGRFGHGQMLLMGDYIFIMGESGDLILVRPEQPGLNEVARFKVFESKTWNPAAMSGRYLLVRNDREAALVELPQLAADARRD